MIFVGEVINSFPIRSPSFESNTSSSNTNSSSSSSSSSGRLDLGEGSSRHRFLLIFFISLL
jgi:hypothetical protein